MRRGLAGCLAVAASAVVTAGAAAHTDRAGVPPLRGVWKGDVVRIHEGAIIGRNVLTLKIWSARVGATFKAELPRSPACTARFRITKRLAPTAWVAGIPRSPAGNGGACVLAGFNDAYTPDAFQLFLLDNRRLLLVGLSHGVRVQATLFRQR